MLSQNQQLIFEGR